MSGASSPDRVCEVFQLSRIGRANAHTAEDYDPVPADLVRIGFVPEGMEARYRKY